LKPASEKTAEKLAKEYGVSPATIRRDATFAKAVDKIAAAEPAAKDVLLKGDVKLPAKAAGAVLGMEPDQVVEVAKAVATKSVKSVADVKVTSSKKKSPSRPKANGKEVISAKERKSAMAAMGVVIRFVDKLGKHDEQREHLESILACVRGK
jgi:hypothetical protein